MNEGAIQVCLYSPADLNKIDGSSIWVQSVAETLHTGGRVQVTIPLRSQERRDLLTAPLRALDRVRLVDPRRQRRFVPPTGLIAAEALDLIEKLDRQQPFDVVLIRSFAYCQRAIERTSLVGRLWAAYVLEPERDVDDPVYISEMARIAEASRYVVVQSEEMRALFEALVPAGRGKTILLPPAVPQVVTADQAPPARARLVYVGKFHPFYPVGRIIDLLLELRRERPDVQFHVAGDKIPFLADQPDYRDGLRRALTTSEGVVWHGGLSRAGVAALLAEGGVALSVWDFAHGPEMNELVVSTKLLDYCAAGLPVILNRTLSQEGVLGPDYPLFVSGVEEVLPRVRDVLSDPDLYAAAATRTREAARPFVYSAVYGRLAPFLEGQSAAPLRLFERPKLPAAERNIGVQLRADGDLGTAWAVLDALRRDEGRWRVAAAIGGLASPDPGADPARASLGEVPPRLEAWVTARTVDDFPNWWRTMGFVLVTPWTAADFLHGALASGAVPIVIGPQGEGQPALARWTYEDATRAAAAVRDIVAEARWPSESERARSVAFSASDGS